MRVLLDCRMASWSGVGRYTTGLARALDARADVELVQVCAPGEPAPAQAAEVVTAARHPFGPAGTLELGLLARRAGADLLHCPHFPTPFPATTPLVVTLHDLIPLVLPQVMPSGIKRALYRLGNGRAARAACRVIVPSASTARDVSRLFPRAGAKLTVIPEAADDFSVGEPAPLRPDLARVTGLPYLLAMGNTRWHKDLPTLLRAFAEVAPKWTDLRLVLAGPEVPRYLEEHLPAPVSQLRPRLIFTGRVSDGELRTLYSEALAFVFPSRYEGFGLPVLEAMAAGTPVICSDAASLPEVAGEAAVIFPAGDAGALAGGLEAVLNDPALRADLARRGLYRAAEFTWERTAAATVRVYQEALECG